ncbi:SEL1-like repeat protein [Microvirga antarctica]|uniref:SEL1-like repeat protein n=1 Tax=Microvirga antarctica TaxID=2819233 RepID=UPI001B302F73|nr:SEL1-like repeat protein [Microvirga antarctica]
MRRPVLAHLDDLDPQTRTAAEAAASKAGLRLEDWVGEIMADRLVGHEKRRDDGVRAGASVDSILGRMTKSAPKASIAPTAGSDFESVAAWVEKAERALAETNRRSADHQDRMASAMTDALSALKDRLDAIEQRVNADAAPVRVTFPVEEAVRALSPLSDTMLGLRGEMERLADRLERPASPQPFPAVEGIRAEIEDLRAAVGALATRDEVRALDDSLRSMSRDVDSQPSGHAVMTMAGAITTLHGQIADLSAAMGSGLHPRIAGDLESLDRKIDRLSETGIDRSVVDFLSSQIVDMRHDLSTRAEPRQIADLAADLTALRSQVAELRAHQVVRSDFTSLKASLEKVCGALSEGLARHAESDVSEQIRNLGDRLEALADRPDPQPANLEPIAAQLKLLTESLTAAADQRMQESEAVQARFDLLSGEIEGAFDAAARSEGPLAQRFDRIERQLRALEERAEPAAFNDMLRAMHEKLQAPGALDRIEHLLASFEDRLAARPDAVAPEPVSEAIHALRKEASAIAELAARDAVNAIQAAPVAMPFEATGLAEGFAALKALQVEGDARTQQILTSVQDALATLTARFADRVPLPDESPEPPREPADRLEAAVRRLHAATLSQIEDLNAAAAGPDLIFETRNPDTDPARAVGSGSGHGEDLGKVRSSFIAAARRASQSNTDPSRPRDFSVGERERSSSEAIEGVPADEASPPPAASLVDKLRQRLRRGRKPLLFGVTLLILASGTLEALSRLTETTRPAAAVGTTGSMHRPIATAALPTSQIAPAVAISPAADIADLPDVLRRAASAGDPAALYEMATRLLQVGTGPEDRVEAARLFERAALAGLPVAQERIGSLYEQGAGVERDRQAAASWFERAAQAGNLQAMHNLATLLAGGLRGTPDYAGAFHWYSEAAEGGFKDSQFNLGVLLTRGIGTAQNLPRAYQWFDIVARQGDADAAGKRDEIARRLAPPALAAAKLLAARWRARPIDEEANNVRWRGDGRTAASNFGTRS